LNIAQQAQGLAQLIPEACAAAHAMAAVKFVKRHTVQIRVVCYGGRMQNVDQ